MATKKPRTKESSSPKETPAIPARLLALLKETAAPKRFVNPAPVSVRQLRERLAELNLKPSVPAERLVETVNRIKPDAGQPVAKMPEEIKSSLRALKPEQRRLHGSKISLTWFPFPWLASPCPISLATCRALRLGARPSCLSTQLISRYWASWVVDGRSGSRSESGLA